MSVITLHTETTPTPAGLVWEDPPRREQPGKYAPIAAALRSRPGQWAVIRTFPATSKRAAWGFANHINSGRYADLRPTADGARFQAVCRTTDGHARVYARFVPAGVTGVTP